MSDLGHSPVSATVETVKSFEVPTPTGEGAIVDDGGSTSGGSASGPSYAELMNGTVGADFFGKTTKEHWKVEGRDEEGVNLPNVEWTHLKDGTTMKSYRCRHGGTWRG